jgi:hypothetical protein
MTVINREKRTRNFLYQMLKNCLKQVNFDGYTDNFR